MLPKPGEEREGEPATSPPGFSSAAEGDASLAAGDFLRTMDESRFAVSAGAAGAPAVPKLALLALGDAVGPNAPHVPSPPPPSYSSPYHSPYCTLPGTPDLNPSKRRTAK